MFAFLKNIGPLEWTIIVVVLVILFGGKLMKKIAKTSGESFKEAKSIKKSFTDALEDSEEEDKS